MTFCPTDPNPTCVRDYYTLFQLQTDFFRNALNDDDQLRQRVAFALSQIFVTSGLDVREAYGMARYQQIFLDHAFGNYEELMLRVTLSSVMGHYLNMVNNDKPVQGVNPNENYARELLQLFSIGLWELKRDGTLLLDAAGQPIPTYDQSAVEGFAHVFTGWTYPVLPGVPPRAHNPRNYLGDMAAIAANHDTGAKELLDGVIQPAGLSMDDDLARAIRNVFMSPSIAPFVARALIQKLVTGDPSPQYVGRVAGRLRRQWFGHAWRHEGGGARDPARPRGARRRQARSRLRQAARAGALRRPASPARPARVRMACIFGRSATCWDRTCSTPSRCSTTTRPTTRCPARRRSRPEFALQNASTYINRDNVTNTLVFGNIVPLASYPGAIGTQPDWAALQAVAGDANALADRLDALLLHRTMPAAMRTGLVTAVNAIAATDTLSRARTGYYLVVTSSEYQVER